MRLDEINSLNRKKNLNISIMKKKSLNRHIWLVIENF